MYGSKENERRKCEIKVLTKFKIGNETKANSYRSRYRYRKR